MANNDTEKSEIIDLSSFFKLYASKWYWFVISALVCCSLAYFYTKVFPEKYLVRANILIAQDDKSTPSMAAAISAFSGGLFGDNGNVDDEIFMVSSHSVLREVVKDMDLNRVHFTRSYFIVKAFNYKDYPFDVISDNPNIADTLSRAVVFKVQASDDGNHFYARARVKGKTLAEAEGESLPLRLETPYGGFTVVSTPYFAPGEDIKCDIVYKGYHGAAEDIAKDVDIYIASKHSNVIGLDIETSDTDYGRDLLNNIIAKYNERSVRDKNVKGQKTNAFIDSRLALLADELQESESTVEQFKRDNAMVDFVAETTYQLTKKGDLETALIQAITEQELIRLTRDFITDPANAYSVIPGFQGSEPLKGALEQYNALILERINLQQNAKGDNAQLRSVTLQIDAMRNSINMALEKEYENASAKTAELQAQFDNTEGRLGQMPGYERAFRDIMRQQTVKEQLYLFLLQHREETAMMMANSTDKGQVVDEAYALNEPVGLSKIVIMLIALLCGLAIPPVWFYLKQLLRTKFATKEEVEAITAIPVLGEVCEDRSGDTVVITDSATTSSAELLRLIRSNLQFILDNDNDKVVLMTSTKSGEGKSFVAINLAASLALLGKKVLLIGMDIRNPKLGEYLNISSEFGLTQYLSSNRLSLSDIIIKEPVTRNMDVILSGPVPPNPSELLLSRRLDDMIADLRKEYDVIILDSAPIGMVSDTFSLSRVSDATVYICRANYTPIKDIQYINSLYHEGRLKKLSLIVNGTSTKKSYGYGYGSGKGKGKK